jgi:hypothetical protein
MPQSAETNAGSSCSPNLGPVSSDEDDLGMEREEREERDGVHLVPDQPGGPPGVAGLAGGVDAYAWREGG